jgi:NADPH:quinone reductase-like Zn-dependent oxidoreductase
MSTSSSSSSAAVQSLAVVALGGMCCDTLSTIQPLPSGSGVLVSVHYSSLNRLDTLQRSGKMAPPPGASDILGLDFSGTVVSSSVPSYTVGDRVAGLVSSGAHAELCYCHPSHMFKIPDALPLRDAACIPENWITAYQLITAVGGLSKGSTVMIHAAASGVGLALIQLCKHHLQCPVIIATGSASKRDICTSMGATHFVDRNADADADDFVAVAKTVQGGGVDCVLDCVGGPYFSRNLDSICVDGCLVFYGMLAGFEVADSPSFLRTMLMKRITLKPSTLRSRSDLYKSALILDFTMDVLPSIVAGTYSLTIDSEFAMFGGGSQKAHDRMEANDNLGKILLRVKEEEKGGEGFRNNDEAGDKFLGDGIKEMEKGEWVKAAECFTRGVGYKPGDKIMSALLCNRAASHFEVGDTENAEIDAGEAMLLDPKNVDACIRLATYSLSLRMLDQAESALAMGSKVDPGNGDMEKLREEVKKAREKEAKGGLLANREEDEE